MAVRKFAERPRKSVAAQARSVTYALQDEATERAVQDALKASKRARALLRSLRHV